MAYIDFSPKSLNTAASTAKADKPASKIWLNVGYESDVVNEEGNKIFISLPYGIPLDTMEPVRTNSKSSEFAQMQQARNALLTELLQISGKLTPGQDAVINLQVQIRHVNEEAPATPLAANPFARSIELVESSK